MSRVRASVIVAVVVAAVLTGCAPDPVPGDGSASTPPRPTSVATDVGPEETTPAPEATLPSPAPTTTPAAPPLAEVPLALVTYGVDPNGAYASGIIPDLLEQPGTCTLLAVRGGDSRTADISAAAAASSMNCGLIHVAVDAGAWELTLSYASSTSHGTSETVTVSVP